MTFLVDQINRDRNAILSLFKASRSIATRYGVKEALFVDQVTLDQDV